MSALWAGVNFPTGIKVDQYKFNDQLRELGHANVRLSKPGHANVDRHGRPLAQLAQPLSQGGNGRFPLLIKMFISKLMLTPTLMLPSTLMTMVMGKMTLKPAWWRNCVKNRALLGLLAWILVLHLVPLLLKHQHHVVPGRERSSTCKCGFTYCHVFSQIFHIFNLLSQT